MLSVNTRNQQRYCWKKIWRKRILVSLLTAIGIVLFHWSTTVSAQTVDLPKFTETEVVATAPEASQAPLKDEDLLKLTPPNELVKIKIGVHITNLAQIDQANETADVAGYLLYSWQDRRLAYDPQAQKIAAKPSTLDKIWHPTIEIVNFKSSNVSETVVDIAPDGTVLAQERFSKTLSSGLLLQKFPFDRQKILIAVESLKYPEKNVQFSANSDQLSFSKESYTTLSEWRIEQITAQNTSSYFPPEKQNYSRVAITLSIRRNSGYYMLKVMLPLLLITIASWSVFWISPQEFSTQISIAFTNLLTVVALLLVVNDTLPRVGYLTFLDGFTLLCFLGILSAILELIVVHRWTIDGKHQQLADKIHQVARWLVPGLFLLGNVGLVAVTFFLGAPSR